MWPVDHAVGLPSGTDEAQFTLSLYFLDLGGQAVV
jgi:hypothetical protein